MMMNDPEVLHAFLDHLTEALIVYLSYQIESGAQVGIVKPTKGLCTVSMLPPLGYIFMFSSSDRVGSMSTAAGGAAV